MYILVRYGVFKKTPCVKLVPFRNFSIWLTVWAYFIYIRRARWDGSFRHDASEQDEELLFGVHLQGLRDWMRANKSVAGLEWTARAYVY